jgi:hypothetical protein
MEPELDATLDMNSKKGRFEDIIKLSTTVNTPAPKKVYKPKK